MRNPIAFLTAPLLLSAVCAVSGCEKDSQMAITGINPRAGHLAGEQTVEIQGKNFRTDIGYAVYFGKARSKSVAIRSPESIVVVNPAGDQGPVDVTVRADDGNGFVMKQAFSYEDMGGNVVEKMGQNAAPKEKKGNLAF